MSVNLITGYAGTAHITSAGDGAVNAGMFGSGKYVLNIGEKFGYEVISNNLIRIKSGYAINQGRKIELAVNDYEEVEIDNGLQGVKRCDLIVMHYEKSLTTGIEAATMQVIKGTSGDDYIDPAYTSGDIINGANEDDFLLYRVKINGLNIETVESLFSVTNSILDLLKEQAEVISGLNESLSETQDSINESQINTEKYINERIQTTQKSIEDLRTYTDKSIENTNKNVNDLDSSTQKSIRGLNEEVAKRALTTHVHSVESVGATINTSNFKDSSDSWLSVRKVGHIAICTFSLTTAKQLSADADYNICKLDAAALYSVRAAASCSGNINGDISIQNNALNYIKISAKSALAAGKTVKGEIVFFV